MPAQQLEVNHNNDVDLIQLLLSLWKQKWLIILITALGSGIGFTYILVTKPIYQAKVLISPPTLADIEGFNHGRSKKLLPPFTVDDVYDVFRTNLFAESTKRRFYNDYLLKNLPDESNTKILQSGLYKEFSSNLLINEVPHSTPVKYEVLLKNVNPVKAATFLKVYLKLTKQITIDEMVSIIKKQSERITSDLEHRINIERQIAKDKRSDRLAILKEAIAIAKATGTQNQALSPLSVSITDISALNDPSMMYLRGSKALESEVKNLSNRISDDPFIPQIRNMQGDYHFYKEISISKDAGVFRLDGEIKTPDLPFSPKKRMILIRSILLAFVLAIAFASFRYVLGRQMKI